MDLLKWKIKTYYSLLCMYVLRLRSRLLLMRYPFLRWSTQHYGYTNYDDLPRHIRKNHGHKILQDLKRQYQALSTKEEKRAFHVNFFVDGEDGEDEINFCIFRW